MKKKYMKNKTDIVSPFRLALQIDFGDVTQLVSCRYNYRNTYNSWGFGTEYFLPTKAQREKLIRWAKALAQAKWLHGDDSIKFYLLTMDEPENFGRDTECKIYREEITM